MRTPFARRSAPPAPRPGFTLVELLAVIAILSILIALLVPAIMNSRRTARVVQVTSEISALSSAIQNFKQDFGIEPPSSIILCEVGDVGSTSSWNAASKALIGRMWPQFDFTLNRDFDLDGATTTTAVTLTGRECLVFFLGGPTTWIDADSDGTFDSGETVVNTNGFSRNPANPFGPLAASGATNRQGPHFQFTNQNRLVPIQTNSNSIAFTFGYSDPITSTPAPYLYVSSNDGQGYNPTDLAGSTMTDAYRNGTSATSPYYNPNGYQIIAAGFDGRYGTGGPYQKGTDMGVARDAERDNITNFSSGMLAP